jgi:hypothetical protein
MPGSTTRLMGRKGGQRGCERRENKQFLHRVLQSTGLKGKAEPHENFVGDGLGIRPMTLADTELEALHRKLSLDARDAPGFAERHRRHDVLGDALDGERARCLVTVAGRRP